LNRYKHVPLDKIKEYIDTLVSEGTRQIVLSGGEPTLHPNIIEILDYAGQTNVNLSLLSNGSSVRSHAVLDAILRNDVVVKMPVLGWRDSHEKMAGLRGSFDRVISSIFTYAKAGIRLQLGTTMTSVNIGDVHKIVRFANFMGLPLEVSPIYKIGFAEKNADILFQHSMRKLIESCRINLKPRKPRYVQKPKTRKTITQHPTDYESVDIREFLTDTHECGQKIIAVLSSGEVTPCLMIRNKYISVGNAQATSLRQVLNGPSREDFNNRMKLSGVVDCRGCEARYVCKAGGCPATALAFKGTINTKNPLYSNCYYVNSETVEELETLNA
jgi:radical SAM protein with 4Fe4S-binding SPASM domain